MSDRALVDNAADERQVESGRSKEQRRQLNRRTDLQIVLDSPHGRRVIARVLEYTGALPLRSVFTGDNAHTNYQAGRQDVGNWLLAELADAKADALVDVLTEILKETE